MNQIALAVLKAVLITLVGTVASICVEKIRRHNEDKEEDSYYRPGYDEYDRY
jgi:hypothetical protein